MSKRTPAKGRSRWSIGRFGSTEAARSNVARHRRLANIQPKSWVKLPRASGTTRLKKAVDPGCGSLREASRLAGIARGRLPKLPGAVDFLFDRKRGVRLLRAQILNRSEPERVGDQLGVDLGIDGPIDGLLEART